MWWEWVWPLCLSQCSESPPVALTCILGDWSHHQDQEKPGEIRLCFYPAVHQLWGYCRAFCLAFCVQKNWFKSITPLLNYIFFVKCRLHERLLSFFFAAYLAVRTFFLLFVCHIFFRLSKLPSVRQFTPEFGVKRNIICSGFILPPLAGRSSWFVVGFTTFIKLGDNLDFSGGKWDGKGNTQINIFKSKYFAFQFDAEHLLPLPYKPL